MKSFFTSFFLFISILNYAQVKTWNNLLQKHVDANGWVNYKEFAKDKEELANYLKYLNQTTPNNSWSANQQKAFWINAYNAYTIQLILEHYPVASILDVKKGDKNAWEIPFAKVGGKTYTLNHIEHKILREKFKDPRIHVGVNCASISCPALPNTAFTEKNIDTLLHKGMLRFVNKGSRNTITESNAELSQIFNWFKDDFTQQGDLRTFINKYSSVKINSKTNITYKDYNWKLNQK